MLFGHTETGKTFEEFDLANLTSKQALVIDTARDIKLFVRLRDSSSELFVNDRPCMSEVVVNEWMSLALTDRTVRNASRVIRVGDFWQYGDDFMTHRVERIGLSMAAPLGSMFGKDFDSLFEPR